MNILELLSSGSTYPRGREAITAHFDSTTRLLFDLPHAGKMMVLIGLDVSAGKLVAISFLDMIDDNLLSQIRYESLAAERLV